MRIQITSLNFTAIFARIFDRRVYHMCWQEHRVISVSHFSAFPIKSLLISSQEGKKEYIYIYTHTHIRVCVRACVHTERD
jgi:hypothetical protein